MDATRDDLQINWSFLKTRVRKHWGKITEDDLSNISGRPDVLINVLRKRYGYGKAQAEIELSNWLVEQDGHKENSK